MDDLPPNKPATWSSQSPDGEFSYALTLCEVGVLLERTHSRRSGQIVHSILLRDEASLARWIEADSVRFTHPLLFSELRRRCIQRFGGTRASHSSGTLERI